MEEFLKIIDESVKRLVTPAIMMVTAVLMFHWAQEDLLDKELDRLLYVIAGLLMFWSIIYCFFP